MLRRRLHPVQLDILIAVLSRLIRSALARKIITNERFAIVGKLHIQNGSTVVSLFADRDKHGDVSTAPSRGPYAAKVLFVVSRGR